MSQFSEMIIKKIFMDFWASSINFLEYFEKKNVKVSIHKEIRIALVKQTCYADLYTNQEPKSISEIIFSSNHRSGPVGLFTNFQTKFYVLNIEDSQECNIYREKPFNKSWKKIEEEQKLIAKNAVQIDWGKFDLVVALENAVPSAVALKYPQVVWATMVEHHRMKSYRQLLKNLPLGYDVFFNQRFGPTISSIFGRKHVIDWPYSINSANSIKNLFKLKKENLVIIDVHQKTEKIISILESLEYNYTTTGGDKSIEDHLKHMVAAKVLITPIKPTTRLLWGNITLESAAADCLVIGNRKNLWNPFLICSNLNTSSYRKLEILLYKIKTDDSFYNDCLIKQRRILQYYGFLRPFIQLNKYLSKKGSNKSIKGKILITS